MSINAISGYSFGSYNYAVTDLEYDEIKKKLAALGISSSGKKSVDKSRLEEAQQEKQLESIQQSKSETVQTSNVSDSEDENSELTAILNELNVTKTDNVESDYKNAVNALRARFLTETTMSEISHLRNLKDNLDRIMAGFGYSLISISASEMTGATAMGEMNKVMMLSAGNFNASGK